VPLSTFPFNFVNFPQPSSLSPLFPPSNFHPLSLTLAPFHPQHLDVLSKVKACEGIRDQVLEAVQKAKAVLEEMEQSRPEMKLVADCVLTATVSPLFSALFFPNCMQLSMLNRSKCGYPLFIAGGAKCVPRLHGRGL
jgi:hypothetical protein